MLTVIAENAIRGSIEYLSDRPSGISTNQIQPTRQQRQVYGSMCAGGSYPQHLSSHRIVEADLMARSAADHDPVMSGVGLYGPDRYMRYVGYTADHRLTVSEGLYSAATPAMHHGRVGSRSGHSYKAAMYTHQTVIDIPVAGAIARDSQRIAGADQGRCDVRETGMIEAIHHGLIGGHFEQRVVAMADAAHYIAALHR